MRVSTSRPNENGLDRTGRLLRIDITRQTFFHPSIHRVQMQSVPLRADRDERLDLRKGRGAANVDGFDGRLRFREGRVGRDFFRDGCG